MKRTYLGQRSIYTRQIHLRTRLHTATLGARSRRAQDVRTNSFQKLGRVFQEKAKADWERVFKGTEKTRDKLGVVDELLNYWKLEDSEDMLEELEDLLLASDFGPSASFKLVEQLRSQIKLGQITDASQVKAQLKANMINILEGPLSKGPLLGKASKPSVVLIVGVNGGGKTTTVGKLSNRLKNEGYEVMLAAGDTFRAAAKEQLEVWADRTGALVADYPEMDTPNPVDVLQSAAEQIKESSTKDLLICDTSGRLHNNFQLMDEIEKCKKILSKAIGGAPHETLLVLDGTTGLNMLNQAREFNDYIGVNGLILTKLDGTARGGAVVGVVDELGIPLRFIGVGETVDDLQPFDAESFVDAILA